MCPSTAPRGAEPAGSGYPLRYNVPIAITERPKTDSPVTMARRLPVCVQSNVSLEVKGNVEVVACEDAGILNDAEEIRFQAPTRADSTIVCDGLDITAQLPDQPIFKQRAASGLPVIES